MFEQYINKKVSIKLLDGFVKYGIVENVINDFILLRFKDGKRGSISIKDIAGITEVDLCQK